MYFITVRVLLIFMPYHMLLLEKMVQKDVLILKADHIWLVMMLLLELVTSVTWQFTLVEDFRQGYFCRRPREHLHCIFHA